MMETREKETLNEDVENIAVVNWQYYVEVMAQNE